jgi:aspartate/methionine/tyrosine aminotransferase
VKYEISPIRKFDEKVRELESKGERIIKAHIGDVNYPYPSFIGEALCEYVKGGYEEIFGKWSKYSPFKGFSKVREAVAENENVEASNILPCLGAMGGLSVSFKSLASFGVKKVFIPDVGFNPYYVNSASLSNLEISLYEIRLQKNGVDFSFPKVEEDCCVLINSPHNPTGYIFEKKDLENLMKEAKEKENCWIISDNPYKHIYLRKRPTNLIDLSKKLEYKSFIEIISFSKFGPLPGLRTGYIFGNSEFIERAATIQFNTFVHPPTLSQVALYFFAKEKKKMEMHYENLREEMREREQILGKLESRIERVRPEGAIYEMIRVGKDDLGVCEEILEKEKVSLAPGSGFGNNGRGWARIAFGALEKSEIEEMVEKLNDFFVRKKGNIFEV